MKITTNIKAGTESGAPGSNPGARDLIRRKV
jgi:hypothetical protein